MEIDFWGDSEEINDVGYGLIERDGTAHFAPNPRIDPYITQRAERWYKTFFAPNLLKYGQVCADGTRTRPDGPQIIWSD